MVNNRWLAYTVRDSAKFAEEYRKLNDAYHGARGVLRQYPEDAERQNHWQFAAERLEGAVQRFNNRVPIVFAQSPVLRKRLGEISDLISKMSARKE